MTFLSALLSSAPEKRPRNRIKYGGNGESRGEKDPAARKGKKKKIWGDEWSSRGGGGGEVGVGGRAWESLPDLCGRIRSVKTDEKTRDISGKINRCLPSLLLGRSVLSPVVLGQQYPVRFRTSSLFGVSTWSEFRWNRVCTIYRDCHNNERFDFEASELFF